MRNRLIAWALALLMQQTAVAEIGLAGIWSNDDYLNALQRTHSPRAAIALHPVPLLWIDADGKRLAISMNMHEMPEYAIQTIAPSGALRLASAEDWISALQFKKGALTLTHRLDDITTHARFSRVAGAGQEVDTFFAHFVAERLLAGEYSGEQDRRYRFSATEADWNGERFAYTVVLDYVEFSPIDLLCRADTHGPCQTLYGFVIANNALQIYQYDADAHRIGPLLLDLTRR